MTSIRPAGFAGLCLILSVAVAGAQTALQINPNCSMQNVVAPSGTLRLENVVINCGKGADPRTALKINYFWLDAFSAALLLAGRDDARLRDLFGARPVILTNEVMTAFEDLQRRFGSTIGRHSLFKDYYDHFTTKVDGVRGGKREYQTQSKSYRSPAFNAVRVFDGMSPIYWPDVDAVREMTMTPSFPNGYRHYVREVGGFADAVNSRSAPSKVDVSAIMNAARISRVFYRDVPASELTSYRERLSAMKQAATAGSWKLHFPAGTEPATSPDAPDDTARDKEKIVKLPDLATNKAVSATQFITRDGMPAGFLTAYGIEEDHGDTPLGWGIVALPRRLFLQVAVIENTAATPTDYDLDEFTVLRETETKLRKPTQSPPAETRSIPFPQKRFSHRERVVIPLAIEFREHRKVGAEDRQENLAPSAETFALLRRGLARIPQSHVVGQDMEGKPMKDLPPKSKTLFQTSEPPNDIEPVYVYGPRIVLQAAKLQGEQIPIRTAMAAGVYRVAGFEGGSCPVLYYRTHRSAEWHKVGNILRLASGKSRQATEFLALPNDVSEVALAEEEPERTYVSRIEVVARNDRGRERTVVTAGSPFTLDAEQVWTAVVPPLATDEKAGIRVTGYYVPYAWAFRTGKSN